MPDNEQVTLHGGPWHGQLRVLERDTDHFHISSPRSTAFADPPPAFVAGTDAIQDIPRIEGMYSRVGKSHDFEWEGWRSHD